MSTLPGLLVEVAESVRQNVEEVIADSRHEALDTVRHCALQGDEKTLLHPPPALVHESKYASSSFLYGCGRRVELEDVEYKEGRWKPLDSYKAVLLRRNVDQGDGKSRGPRCALPRSMTAV